MQIEELYERYAALVYRRCLILLGSPADAEDALQEVFVRALRAADEFRGEAAPSTWLYRIATNHCLNVLRGQKRRRARLQRQAREADPPPNLPAERMEAAALLRQVLPGFDQRTQRMAVGYFVDGMSQEEIARDLGLSVPTVRKYLQRFVRRANKRLERGSER